ncbi:MAG TPA: energy transducer TonB [Gemmatimonadaceae bacterium]
MLAVWQTLHPETRDREPDDDRVAVVDLSVFSPPAAVAPVVASRPSRGFQVLTAPSAVLASISVANLKAPETIPEDFTGRGIVGGLSDGIGVAPVSLVSARGGEPIDGSLADEPPYMLPGQMGPAYPDSLRVGAPDGLVVVRFVIDTLGLVEPRSLDIVESSHPAFVASVQTALSRLRFLPAHFSGQRVRVRMEQRFEFHLAKRG